MKEFLAARGVAFESINVLERAEAMAELRSCGMRGVPVVARGERMLYGQDLGQVSALVGVDYDGAPALSAAELTARFARVLRAARRYATQIPRARLDDLLPNRPRSYLSLVNHIAEIAAAWLEVADGADFDGDLARAEREPPTPMTELAVELREVAEAVAAWPPDDVNRSVTTYYGSQTLHAVLERCTWHAAQHTRQLMMVLAELGVNPDGPLTAADFDGLPMPEAVWDPA